MKTFLSSSSNNDLNKYTYRLEWICFVYIIERLHSLKCMLSLKYYAYYIYIYMHIQTKYAYFNEALSRGLKTKPFN